MPSYKLTYFSIRGLAEPARLMFHLAGVPFEDVRMVFPSCEWDKKKKTTPMHQLPVLSVDGFEIPQSGAINGYLARKFGFAGKTAKDQAWVDATTDLYKDFFEVFRKMIRARRNKLPTDEVAKLTSEVIIPARDPYFEILNGILERNKSGYLVGDDITLADLAIAENVESLKNYGLFKAEEQPKLAALREKVYSHSALKNYIANRPFTEH